MAHRASNLARNRWTLDLLALKPDDRVLEVGCGPGVALALAAERTPAGSVTGVDHSEAMISMARGQISRIGQSDRVSLILGDDTALEGYDGALDVVFSANTIQFLSNPAGYFWRAATALAPGGRIATTYQPRGEDPRPSHADEMADRCASWMSDSGFSDIRTEYLSGQGLPVICVLGRRTSKLSTAKSAPLSTIVHSRQLPRRARCADGP